MDKNKVSLIASYVAIACGIVVILLQFFTPTPFNKNTIYGVLFLIVGVFGIKTARK